MVRIGMLGCGFMATFYMQVLQDIPNQQVAVVYARNKSKASDFATRWHVPESSDDLEAVVARPDLDLIVIALPNNMHLPAMQIIARHKKNVACTKPLGRNADEARQMLELARQSGAMHGYGENQIFCPAIVQAKQLIDDGAIGRVLTVRAREAHAGPHAAHFWNIEESGGGALIDLACHTIEVGRHLIGKHVKPVEVLAWGDTLVHMDKTKGEDNTIVLVRYEDGSLSQSDLSWTARGSFDMRGEIYGTDGSIFVDAARSTPITAFVRGTGTYLVEKAESNTGWIFPLPDEARVYGYHGEIRHFIDCVAQGKKPYETFEDGLIVNIMMDAAYQSIREHRWVPIDLSELGK